VFELARMTLHLLTEYKEGRGVETITA